MPCHITRQVHTEVARWSQTKEPILSKTKGCCPQSGKDSLAPWFCSIPVGYNDEGNVYKDTGLGNGVTNHSLGTYGATELFHSNVPKKLIQQRTWHRSLEALRKYERVAGAGDGCLPCLRRYEASTGQAGSCYSWHTSGSTAAVHPTKSNAAATMATVLHPAPPMLQPAPVPHLSGCTLSNCTINITNTVQPQAQRLLKTSSILT